MLILPNGECKLVQITHPRNGTCYAALIDGEFYELIEIPCTNSSLTSTNLYENTKIQLGLKLNIIYLVLPAMFSFTNPIPADIIQDLSQMNFHDLLRTTDCLDQIADKKSQPDEADMYVLNHKKLKNWLDSQVEILDPIIPESLHLEALRKVTPLSSDPVTNEIRIKARKYTTVQFISNSWLNAEVAEWYLNQWDFTELINEAEKIQKILNLQNLSKSAETPSFSGGGAYSSKLVKKPVKKPKLNAEGNRSLLDMFKR